MNRILNLYSYSCSYANRDDSVPETNHALAPVSPAATGGSAYDPYSCLDCIQNSNSNSSSNPASGGSQNSIDQEERGRRGWRMKMDKVSSSDLMVLDLGWYL